MRIEIFQGKVYTLILRSFEYAAVIYSGFDEDVARDMDRAFGLCVHSIEDFDDESEVTYELTIWEHGVQISHEWFDGEKWKPILNHDDLDDDDDEGYDDLD